MVETEKDELPQGKQAPRKRSTERMEEDGFFSWRTKQRKRHLAMVKKIIEKLGGKATREKIIATYESTPNADREWGLNKDGKHGSCPSVPRKHSYPAGHVIDRHSSKTGEDVT